MADKEEKVATVEEQPNKKIKRVELSSEQIASRQRAHAIKVVKFLAGGEF